MKLPNHQDAVVPERKIRQYLLSLTHRDGRSKAAFFTRFGFVPDDWEALATALRRHAAEHEVVEVEATPFGTSYTIAGSLSMPDGRSAQVRVIWFIETGERIPRLVTAYPQKGTHNA